MTWGLSGAPYNGASLPDTSPSSSPRNAFEGVVALDVEARHEMDPKTGRKDAETWPNPGLHSFLDFTLDSRRQLLLRGAESIQAAGSDVRRTELSRDARRTSGQQT